MNDLLFIAGTICQSTHIEEAFSAAVRTLKTRMHARTVALVLIDHETGRLRIPISRGLSETFLKRFDRDIGLGAVAELLGQCGPQVLSADRTEPFEELRLENPASSIMATPLRVEGKSLGYLYVDHDESDHFSDDDARFMEVVALLLALAVDRNHYQELYTRSHHQDELTGLFARDYFRTRLTEEIARARRDDEPMSMLLISADNLNLIRSVHGQEASRQNLAKLITEVLHQVRVYDNAGRFGPEEVAVYLPHTTLEQAEGIGTRVLGAIEEAWDDVPTTPRLPLKISIGVATLRDEMGTTELVDLLQEAVLQARKAGGNCIARPPR